MTEAFIFILGLCIGSFLNCIIWRLHQKQTAFGRSYCPKCKQQIAWYDNIPLISFLILKGKCRKCHKPISIQYPLVELITGILFIIAFIVNFQFSIFIQFSIFNIQYPISNIVFFLRDIVFISALIVIFVYDFRWYLILDAVTAPAMVFALIINLYLGYSITSLLLAGVIGGGFFLLQYVVSKGKWIGGGDIRLGALMGLMLGWPQILTALMLAYIFGSIIGIILLIAGKKKWSSQIPFGTFLAVATIVVLFWGEEIVRWYFNIL